MTPVELADVERLVSGEGWGLLQSLPPYDETGAMALADRLRRAGFEPALVAAALTQSRLRARAVAKFGDFAAGMLFTADGLEQATRLEVAAHHARRFQQAGVELVHDLGCGIGSDAMAMAGLGLRVAAVDADAVTAAVAGVNLRHWPTASTEVGVVEPVRLSTGETARGAGAWLDPARRRPGSTDARGHTRRVFGLDQISPSWETVLDVAGRLPATGAKLSPAMPHGRVPSGTEAQWTSYDGEVLECAVWWGPLASRPGRSALVLGGPQGRAAIVHQSESPGPPPRAKGPEEVAQWLYEPDRAVLRAGLVGALAVRTGGVELANGVGYVSSPRAVEVAYARRYQVMECMPYNVKSLRAWLRDRDIGRVTVKKRGVALDADLLRRSLRLSGSKAQTIVVTRVGSQHSVLVVNPA